MATYLNQELDFDEVRWATMRSISYDSRASFHGVPQKRLLPIRTKLFRLVHMATPRPYDGSWWMPETVFTELRNQTNRAEHGAGRLLRNYVAQYTALPSGSFQLSVIEIELTQPAYAWIGLSAPLFERPGGMEQIFLPNLAERGDPRTSSSARLVHTYWLKF